MLNRTNPPPTSGAAGSLVFSRPAITTCNLRSRLQFRRRHATDTTCAAVSLWLFGQVRCVCHAHACRVYVQSKTTDDTSRRWRKFLSIAVICVIFEWFGLFFSRGEVDWEVGAKCPGGRTGTWGRRSRTVRANSSSRWSVSRWLAATLYGDAR